MNPFESAGCQALGGDGSKISRKSAQQYINQRLSAAVKLATPSFREWVARSRSFSRTGESSSNFVSCNFSLSFSLSRIYLLVKETNDKVRTLFKGVARKNDSTLRLLKKKKNILLKSNRNFIIYIYIIWKLFEKVFFRLYIYIKIK